MLLYTVYMRAVHLKSRHFSGLNAADGTMDILQKILLFIGDLLRNNIQNLF